MKPMGKDKNDMQAGRIDTNGRVGLMGGGGSQIEIGKLNKP
jgi:hypothetical protein